MTDHITGGKGYPSTDWDFIRHAGAGGGEEARRALGELLRAYMPALRARLVHEKGFHVDAADDLLQGFITSQVLEHGLVARADPRRGQFRNLLLASLDHYLANQMRDEKRLKRRPATGPPAPLGERELTSDALNPSELFDIAWARQAIHLAMDRMRDECEKKERSDLWDLFNGRIAGPALDGTPPLTYEQIVEQFKYKNPSQATNALVTAKRMFARALRSVVARYALTETEIEEEILRFHEILQRPRRTGRPTGNP